MNLKMQLTEMTDERLQKSIDYQRQQLELMYEMKEKNVEGVEVEREKSSQNMLKQLIDEQKRREKFSAK